MKLFVAGLPYEMDDVDLKEMFELYGMVVSAKVATDRETRRSKGFGFVEFASAAEAREVIGLLNGRTIGGRELVVKESDNK